MLETETHFEVADGELDDGVSKVVDVENGGVTELRLTLGAASDRRRRRDRRLVDRRAGCSGAMDVT